MNVRDRFREIRTGFERPFWVANISELFERLSYYAAFVFSLPAISMKHWTSRPNAPRVFPAFSAAWSGFWPNPFGGAIADRLGFRRALSLAYLILAAADFTLGSDRLRMARSGLATRFPSDFLWA